MELPQSSELNIGYLSRLFDNTSECYKFFWFQAVLQGVREGRSELSFEELIDEMIAEAWYMVSEYHLNLGPRDNLESVIGHVQKTTGMAPAEKKAEILKYLASSDDREILRLKRVLMHNVPYRLQAPFMPEMKGSAWNCADGELARRVNLQNQQNRLIYYFAAFSGLQTRIRIEPAWADYLKRNMEIVEGWVEYNLILYLQRRNPNVPGISEKLYPPQERRLESVKKYWKLLVGLQPVREIYGGLLLTDSDISIDHFVPWSYVAHDELWNLLPTTKSINSSKSNSLPEWDVYFGRFAEQEYFSYRMIWQYDSVHAQFEKCAKEHLNSDEIRYRLYREGLEKTVFEKQLAETVQPVYQSAKNCGFGEWVYR